MQLWHSEKVAKCLVIKLVTRMNGLMRLPLSLSTIKQNHSPESAGDRRPVEPDTTMLQAVIQFRILGYRHVSRFLGGVLRSQYVY